METVGPKYHEEVGIAIQFGFAVGYVTLAGVAWFFRHWFWLQLVISLAFLPFAPAFRVVPESPRWLQTRGKVEKLKQLLATAARVNNRKLKAEASEFVERKDLKENETRKTATMLEVMKLSNLRKRTFKMIYLWFVNAFLYYAVAYSTSDLAGDPYVNCFLAGLVEVPARGLVFFGVKKWGRRPTLVLNMALAGAFFLADLPAPADVPWLNTAFAMACKFCVTGSFAVLYLYTTEVFPTGVRNAALGTCSMCARIGSILAPFLRDLGKVIPPSAINAFLALTGALLALTLPETRGLELPDTLQEGEDLGQ
ncbi:Organic cation transporter protein [Araneus ventricosus]|uniref:Organic cation transporter protein n=1 Tax=Araneus ventricosus TaxID=182803 RepID=A0A4Y2MKD3_ARAVE|nr:Organic cation transporter protein [Araneus ventricosus]